jgi:uncharacterized protein with ParB-like and HNH nuclease domain
MPKFINIKRMTQTKYHVDVSWNYITEWLKSNKVNMNPDFQRNYVWSQKQKIQYLEWILRGGNSGKELYFNHPNWFKSFKGEMVIVDGKQRIESVLGFLNNKIKVYGYYYKQYEDKLNMLIAGFSINVADLENRSDVLQWYIDMNTGGTCHTDKEINHVKKLLLDCY